ncbi:fumarylacetoacetate hydrolase family protein [Gayadomonas joobiniege]|uniref:fumarylacetoacetate hydrolase family protein n=1 Tax=Gayadomonas joobiniege TaxID=1234606 RepID=UPI00036ACE84|nr:fumarylacetoacetate hydrolase family protein [Gayadomonas joobiniege]
MKLLRVGPAGQEKPAVLDKQNKIRDISSLITDVEGQFLSNESLAKLAESDFSQLPELSAEQRIGPCVNKVGKFICIGLNYSDHAAETGMQVPEEPVVFMKATSSITGPNDDIIKPKNSTKLDWEVELGIVIGEHTAYVDEADAEKHIAGYCLINDISERAFQIERQGQWCKGKGCDTFGPIGPWLVTKDEIEDVTQLPMWLEVNGKQYQNGNTNTMVYQPAFIVSYLSQFMSLQPGDIISTGTPPGVGMGQNPAVYLNHGDKMKLGIDGLGEQTQTVVDYTPAG